MADPKPVGAIDWTKIFAMIQQIAALLASLRQTPVMQAGAHTAHMTDCIDHQVQALQAAFECLKECDHP